MKPKVGREFTKKHSSFALCGKSRHLGKNSVAQNFRRNTPEKLNQGPDF